jgi:hypothetical protein
MKSTCRSFRTACLLLAGACCLAGCENGGNFTVFGYTTVPTFDPDIHTVYIPIAKNFSSVQGLEFQLTRAVIQEMTSYNSPYRYTSCKAKADTQLEMKIVMQGKNVIILNQNGENRNAEQRLVIEVVWRDLRPGHIGNILSNPKKFDPGELPLPGEPLAKAPKEIPYIITPVTTYAPEVGGSMEVAQQQLVRSAAMQIIQMMEVYRR